MHIFVFCIKQYHMKKQIYVMDFRMSFIPDKSEMIKA